jgi:hypothetical protein
MSPGRDSRARLGGASRAYENVLPFPLFWIGVFVALIVLRLKVL